MWVLCNTQTFKRYEITKSEFIGRTKEALITTDDTGVSRMHAKVTISSTNLLQVQDLKSTNGTYINYRKIEPMDVHVLNEGDVVAFGNINEKITQLTPLTFKVMQQDQKPLLNNFVIDLCVDEDSKSTTDGNYDKETDRANNSACIADDKKNIKIDIKKENDLKTIFEESFEVKDNSLQAPSNSNHTNDVKNNDSNRLNIASELIVISDDEEDFFSSSQLFKLDKQIKKEHEGSFNNEQMEDFLAIKREVEYLDEVDAGDQVLINQVPINVESEIDDINDLFRILEDTPQQSQINPHNAVLNNEIVQPQFNFVQPQLNLQQSQINPHNAVLNIEVVQNQLNLVQPQLNLQQPQLKLEEPQLNHVQSHRKPEPSHVKSENSNEKPEQPSVSFKKPKYVKPPIVEPHVVKIKGKGTKDDKSKKSSNKHLESGKKEASKKKEAKSSDTSKPKSHEIPNLTAKTEKKPTKRKKSANEGQISKRIKVTDPSPSTSKSSKPIENNTKSLTKTSKSGSKSSRKPSESSSKSNIKTTESSSNKLNPTLTENSDKSKIEDRKRKLKELGKPNSVQKTLKVKLDRKLIGGEKHQNSGTSKNHVTDHMRSGTGLVPTAGPSKPSVKPLIKEITNEPVLLSTSPPYKTSKSPLVDFLSINIEDVYTKITNWKAKWFEEQKVSSHSPPIHGEGGGIKVMPKSFNSFDQYHDTISSLVYYELWSHLYDSLFKNTSSSPIIAQLTHTRMIGNLVYMDCICYADESASKRMPAIKPNESGLLEVDFKNKSGNFRFIGLTVVTNFSKVFLNNESKIFDQLTKFMKAKPYSEYQFTLVMKNLPDAVIENGTVVLKLFSSIGGYLNLFRTVRYLKINTTLSNLILRPKPTDYQVKQTTLTLPFSHYQLNEIQMKIVREACEVAVNQRQGFYLIKGPPGTGKSTVIVNIILQIILHLNISNAQILLTAPSNAAVDALISKILEIRSGLSEADKKKIRLIRMGYQPSISKVGQTVTLHTLAINMMERGCVHSNEYKTTSMLADYNAEKFLKNYMGASFANKKRNAEDMVLFKSNIIATTLNSSVTTRLTNAIKRGQLKFLCCIIDEAAQANELETLQPILLGIEKFILVGDPQQLPATVLNKDAKDFGYGKSLFTRITENFESVTDDENPVRMLEEQYRMDPEICSFPNKRFYQNRLKSLPNKCVKLVPTLRPYLLFNIRATTANNDNYLNQIEVNFIHKLLDLICTTVKRTCKFSIGVITPYTAQRAAIERDLDGIISLKRSNISYTVNTVDSFQGGENDIILISCVRLSPNTFLKNENRLNVALTRAKQALYIIGNYNLFKHTNILYDLREDAKVRDVCLDIDDVNEEFTQHLDQLIFLQ